jgi:hypothetical protein
MPLTPWDRDETLRLCAIQVEEARSELERARRDGMLPWAAIQDAIRLLSQNELAARLRAVRERT